MKLEVDVPGDSVGNVLARNGLRDPMTIGGDQLPAANSALIALDQAQGGALIPTTIQAFDMFDDETHEEGAMEPDGIYGNRLTGLTRFEGNYTFRGIDPKTTTVNTKTLGTLSGGRKRVLVTVTPKDLYGNFLGPGRIGDFEVGDLPGSQPQGPLVDAGDGSYVQEVAWDPTFGLGPGLALTQPDRPPVIAGKPASTPARPSRGCFLLLLVAVLAILLTVLTTARNGSADDE
jgi:hypothetical protein